uniref:Interleukin-8 n=1 Tax=Callorhinchus milii TaxID=7868 RepID=V9LK62_CALMI
MNSKVIVTTLSLLAFYVVSTQAASLRRTEVNLRCNCIRTNSNFIHPKFMDHIDIFPSGPHCPVVEIIATLKSGNRVCLYPEASWVKKIIEKMMTR